MVSSKAVSSSASRNSDLRRKRSCSSSAASTKSSSISDLHVHNKNHHHHQIKNSSSNTSLGSMTIIDNLLPRNNNQNTAAESTLLDAEITLLDAAGAVTAISDNETNVEIEPTAKDERKKTVDDVWKEIVAGRRECKKEAPDEMMTLEDFLAKAEAVEEEEEEEDAKVKVRQAEMLIGGIHGFDSMKMMSPFPSRQVSGGVVVVVGYGNGEEEVIGGRGKRRALLEPLDKAAQQRQRRMIKNRESAARSRERKQAYQVELESLAVKLEEENEKLLKEKAERTRQRFKRLMEKVVPVGNNRRPPRVLRRVHSMQW